MTTIIVTHDNDEIDEFDFEPEIKLITIGRRSTNDVCIPNLSVSGSHAKIDMSDSGTWVEDLSSTNGTYINGRLISRQLLNDGDDIVLGNARITFLQPNLSPARTAAKRLNAVSSKSGMSDQASLSNHHTPVPLSDRIKPSGHETDAHDADPFEPDFGRPDTDQNRAEPDRQALTANRETGIPADNSMYAEVGGEDGPQNAGTASEQSASRVRDAAAAPIAEQAEVAIHDAKSAAHVTPQTASQITGAVQTTSSYDTDQTQVGYAGRSDTVTHDLDAPGSADGAVIEIKNGAKSGQILPIDKPVTTLGRPGIQIAAIMKKPDGYFIMHIESDTNIKPPSLNSNAIGDEPVLLKSGDALNVAGIDVEFMQPHSAG